MSGHTLTKWSGSRMDTRTTQTGHANTSKHLLRPLLTTIQGIVYLRPSLTLIRPSDRLQNKLAVNNSAEQQLQGLRGIWKFWVTNQEFSNLLARRSTPSQRTQHIVWFAARTLTVTLHMLKVVCVL